MSAFFFIIFAIGTLYLLLTIVGGMGAVLDFDLDVDEALSNIGLGGFFGLEGAEIGGEGQAGDLGCNVIAGFLTAFGAVGLAASLAGWNVWAVMSVALIVGYVVGRLIARFVRFVYAQQSTTVQSVDTLIGTSARITINTNPGSIGEAIVEAGSITKYAVREVNDVPLQRDDLVEIVGIDNHVLQVKKKRG